MLEAAAYQQDAAPGAALPNWSRALWTCVALGCAIRAYLSLTNFCISGDGAAYIRMAQEYAAGEWRKPLGAVFSPLYPLLIAVMHGAGLNWELAGNLVSTLAGTAAIIAVYLLTREIFDRELIAIGAAALTAIHPELAAYSASVRTEAGFILLTTLTAWLLLRALRRSSAAYAILAGAAGGLAYLYRTEAIVLLVIATGFPLACALGWRAVSLRGAATISGCFIAAATIFVAPYIVMLHAATGHWTVGREFTAAVMYGIGSASSKTAHWRHLGFSAQVSPLSAIMAHPQAYLRKIASDFVASIYGFVEALGPVIAILLVVGLWRRSAVISDYREALAMLIIVAYFCAFTLTATGPRFMVHLIPFAFGWAILGLKRITGAAQAAADTWGLHLAPLGPALVVALILLPRTLWPIGYDMRGMRYAGEAIAADNPEGGAVIARDGRVAWYAHATFLALPNQSRNLCAWIAQQQRPAYVLIGGHDEQQFGAPTRTPCLRFVKRYPRYGSGYYDLYAVTTTAARAE